MGAPRHLAGLLCAAVLCSLFGSGCERESAETASPRMEVACSGISERSGWLGEGLGRYSVSADAFVDEGVEFADVWGLAVDSDDDVLVFDAGNNRVAVLDDDLALIDSIGREGRGPGEFTYQRLHPGSWLASQDSTFVVFGLGRISEFSEDGEFLRYPTTTPPFPVGVSAIAYGEDGIVFATNDVDPTSGQRALTTWALESTAPHTVLRVDSMPPLPRWRGRLVRGEFAQQAEPLWGIHAGCVVISDGAGDWLLRADLASGRSDTLRLPARSVPSRRDADLDRLRRLRSQAAALGISDGSGRRPRPSVSASDPSSCGPQLGRSGRG